MQNQSIKLYSLSYMIHVKMMSRRELHRTKEDLEESQNDSFESVSLL